MLRSFPNADAAEDAATLGAAAGRGQAASGAVACAASAAVAWTGASAWSVESCAAHGDASGDANAHREGRGQARGEAIAMVYAALLQSTPGRSINPKVVSVEGVVLACLVAPTSCHGSPQENREICGGVWGPAGCGIVFASIQLTEPSPMR